MNQNNDFYFDARYPGDNYVDVDEDSCMRCLATMYDVVEEVNKFRKAHDLPYTEFERKMLSE